MGSCNCMEPQWPADELLTKFQFISDCFIALAYFLIPLQLIYFAKKSAVSPYRWVLVQFGAFIVLCGTTHLINLWTFNTHSRTIEVVMTIAKVLTAVVSCATAVMLVGIIPDLLGVKTRELLLKNKAGEPDKELFVHLSHNDFLVFMNHEMRTPMHAVIRLYRWVDLVSRMVTKGLLMHLGCEVAVVSSAVECLRVVSREYKVVFMDLSVPGTGGSDHSTYWEYR
ncbi:hypothetical protein NE237_000595 [Protea cynaroides]|uniref:Ethylene receptor 1-like N-terminal domain-containing protein n=1 Tax=Protea cynaroides TaxID=273540 RepID=A0A9Q0KSI0_9MAGN|nr:hypothetical protein NE237_000595 [Protea cynaroides]